jgi:transposase
MDKRTRLTEWLRGNWWHLICLLPPRLFHPLEALTNRLDPVGKQQMRSRLLEAAPAVQQALDAIAAFRQLLQDRDSSGLEPWLRLAEASALPEIRSFAATLRRDQPAVQAALDYSWSSGRIEGQITKIKVVKRQMFGRGSLDLLKRRVMRAA